MVLTGLGDSQIRGHANHGFHLPDGRCGDSVIFTSNMHSLALSNADSSLHDWGRRVKSEAIST